MRYVNKILVDAIQQGASDIHFEPYEKFYRIRYRRDGELKIINQPPVNQGSRIAARMKVMSRMDLAERRVPLVVSPGVRHQERLHDAADGHPRLGAE